MQNPNKRAGKTKQVIFLLAYEDYNDTTTVSENRNHNFLMFLLSIKIHSHRATN